MGTLKIWIMRFIRVFVKLLYIFPIKNNRILFSSFNGKQYSCSPKYISEYLQLNYPEKLEIVWALREPNAVKLRDVIVVKYASLRFFYYAVTAKVIVDNVEALCFVPKRHEQLTIDTWHGGGAYKRIRLGLDESQQGAWKWRTETASRDIDVFLSSSKCFTEDSIYKSFHYSGKVLNSGLPRNDIFFDKSLVKKASDLVRTTYSSNGIIVLYAPTFREDHGKIASESSMQLPYELVLGCLRKKFKCDIKLLVRAHSGCSIELEHTEDVVNVTDYPDMQELLCAADLLISDYSSCIWDFSLLGRPCILFVPDIDSYNTNERGFITPVDTWPGIKCCTAHDLEEAINNLDFLACQQKAKNHLEALGSYETGHATKQICDLIVDYLDI